MQTKVISFQKHKRLSVVQLLTEQHDTFDYISGQCSYRKERGGASIAGCRLLIGNFRRKGRLKSERPIALADCVNT